MAEFTFLLVFICLALLVLWVAKLDEKLKELERDASSS